MVQGNQKTKLTLRSPEQTLQLLEEACKWAQIEQGRCLQYKRLYREFMREKKISQQHIFAYYELMDIVEIYEHWVQALAEFPGLEQVVKQALSKGPTLSGDENPGTGSNRPRNDIFTIVLAGKLLRAGIALRVVEGIHHRGHADRIESVLCGSPPPDLVIEANDILLRIECKRPLSKNAIEHSAKEACRQIKRSVIDGIIALDCSAAIRPADSILEAPSEERAIDFISDKITEMAKRPVEKNFNRKNILGAILYARVPTHTVQVSPILGPNGNPFNIYRQDSLYSINVLPNALSPQWHMLRSICDSLMSV